MFKSFLLLLILAFSFAVYAQDCEISVKNVNFESANSMTYDVFLKNNSASPYTYSHGSYAWTYDVAFLNGGTPTFSLVPGFSDFPEGAYPPSALVTSPNIVRTSSNMPGPNGTIAVGQSMRLYRFRLQTSAVSFTSQNFALSWKSAATPYTRVFTWNSGTGLPGEVAPSLLKPSQFLLDENFAYGETANPDITAVTTNWVRHSGAQGPGYYNTSLSYSGYASSNVGGSLHFLHGSSGVNDGDVNRTFTAVTTASDVYASFLVNVASAMATADYFFHLGPNTIGTIFRGRVFGRINGAGWGIGLSKSSETRVDNATVLNFNQTYLVVLKYTYNPASASDDVVSLYLYDAGIPSSEPGSPLITIAPTGAGTVSDPTDIGSVAIRQGSNTPDAVIDGIRIGTAWSDIFPGVTTDPLLTVTPSVLSGFSYTGAGPSTSQSYFMHGTHLTPPTGGTIVVSGSSNYEVSSNNSSFGATANIPYTFDSLDATTQVWVRLKSGLDPGIYNNEILTNIGGGDTVTVTCNGVVVKPEPTNHVTNFTGALGVPSYAVINLTWTDATGAAIPDGYLVRCSPGVDSIYIPVDGSPVANSTFNINVTAGMGSCSFTGLNSSKLYFFKIFPYSNSGGNINYKTDGTVPTFNIATTAAATLPLVEKFEYPTGSYLTDNGWVAHSVPGSYPIKVNSLPLTYTGYFASGQGKSVTMTTQGEDVNRAYESVSTGSIYSSFMIKVDTVKTGDYFFHVGPQNSTSLYYAKVFAKDSSGHLAFGIAKNVNGSVVYTPAMFDTASTYLIVTKYTFNSGSSTDDQASLWVNPILNGVEPTPDLIVTDAGTDAPSLGMVDLRQGSTASSPAVKIGGIRVADTWIPNSTQTTFQVSVDVAIGWNMVSIPGLHPTDQNVSTWWPFKVPSSSVFQFSGSYQPVTVAETGKGYWMRHSDARTYNTGDEWPAGGITIVPNNPIPAAAGWNMIGVYNYNVAASGITVSAGSLLGSVFGYAGGYNQVTTLLPGYGYWIRLSQAANIILPNASFKGTAKVTASIDDKWGKIILTDKAGRNYTLYAADGQTDLSQFDMPPAPPAGMMDVRYSSQRFVENITEGFQSIDFNGMEYPVTVRVENTSIRLQDVTGKIVNTMLKTGEKVTISNSQVNKLMVSGNVIPVEYSLSQNYPNPFNPSTLIQFTLPEDVNNVTLTIYDALGQKVAELLNGSMQAGYHQYQWNAANLTSGIYVYQLRTEKFVSTKKMMLLK